MGLSGLTGLVQTADAQTNAQARTEIKTSGNLAYFVAKTSKVNAPTTYAEINHCTTLPYSTKVSGFLDFYRDQNGYFGKTIVEKSLTDNLSLRSHVMHLNEPLSQIGIGASYVVPTPKSTFAKVNYLPLFVDSKGNQVDNKSIVGYFVSADLPWNMSAFSCGEINVDSKGGPAWSYGETELVKKFGRISVGVNLQLNGKGAKEIVPEFVPRAVIRGSF